jgi:hypothetical protein
MLSILRRSFHRLHTLTNLKKAAKTLVNLMVKPDTLEAQVFDVQDFILVHLRDNISHPTRSSLRCRGEVDTVLNRGVRECPR